MQDRGCELECGCESDEHEEIGIGVSAAVEAALPIAYQKIKDWITGTVKDVSLI